MSYTKGHYFAKSTALFTENSNNIFQDAVTDIITPFTAIAPCQEIVCNEIVKLPPEVVVLQETSAMN